MQSLRCLLQHLRRTLSHCRNALPLRIIARPWHVLNPLHCRYPLQHCRCASSDVRLQRYTLSVPRPRASVTSSVAFQVLTPDRKYTLWRQLDLVLHDKESLLIVGPSGMGWRAVLARVRASGVGCGTAGRHGEGTADEVCHMISWSATRGHPVNIKSPPPPPDRNPCQENDPADAHPSAHESVLESTNPRMDSECASGRIGSMARATARLWDGRPPE